MEVIFVDDNLDMYEKKFDYGIEEEEIEDFESEETPFDAEKIRIEQRMLSLKYVKELIDDGSLNLNPDFQRNVVWKEVKRKSLLIESLMLRIPIPAFYFYEDDDSFLNVIDGLQRLNTINEYLNGKFKLKNLQYLDKLCGGKKFADLDKKYRTRIFMTQFSVNIIDARTPTQVKYDLFRRINTGGMPLNAQEIRNSIAKPHIRDFLKRLSNSEEFLLATNSSVNDTRMAAQELILRYIAFDFAYDFDSGELKYDRSDLELFIDNVFERINKFKEDELKEIERKFLRSMNNAFILFGEYGFRKYNNLDAENNYSKRKLVNKSLFSSLSVILTYYTSVEISEMKEKDALKEITDLITRDEVFSDSLTVGTNSVANVQYNFKNIRKTMEDLLL